MEKVLVGLSGGVDSAAVALILKEKGYEVHGVYLAFCPEGDEEGARCVAEKLGIPFYVSCRKKSFSKKVVAPFVAAFRQGFTPNPCVECNRKMKFASLIDVANRLGIEKVATGHYARIIKGEGGRMELWRGEDAAKDQSYFLWKLTQKQLSRILFPLAGEVKEEVRQRAKDLVSPEKKESMEICFVTHGDTQKFVVENGGDTPEGDFVDKDGKILGRHKGISRYTIGQRRGLGVAAGERVFVTEIRGEENLVVLGREEELLVKELFVKDLRFVSCSRKEVPVKGVFFQGRNHGKPLSCSLRFAHGGVYVFFEDAVRKFAPGQSACFYQGDKLLFGGEIAKMPEKSLCAK